MGGGNVHHVQVVSSRVIPSRRQAAPGPYRATRFTTACETQRTISPPGKGPELRKLVAGAGFEPRDLWVMSKPAPIYADSPRLPSSTLLGRGEGGGQAVEGDWLGAERAGAEDEESGTKWGRLRRRGIRSLDRAPDVSG
jgi:hypothetical protein